jgi:aminoglycoside phosphotransferase (APT) family kinase protein
MQGAALGANPDSATESTVPAFDDGRFLDAVAAVLRERLGAAQLEVRERFAGNINLVYHLAYGGRPVGARVALNRVSFKYEPDIIKEVLAILLMIYAEAGPNDAVARRVVDGMLASPMGSHVSHAQVRAIIHYDWSMRRFPFPFYVFEWVEGEALWQRPAAEHYAGAGRDLARLHRIGFAAFYRNLFDAGRRPLAWAESFAGAFARALAEAEAHLPAGLARALRGLAIDDLPPPSPCLAHNDYAGGNILVTPKGERRVIDWDNWVIDAAELDMVKMKYWTAVGADGLLAHDPILYAAFAEGYRAGGGRAIEPARLAAYEALWLLRVYNFERAKRAVEGAAETAWARCYPPPARYADYLAAF